CLAFGNWEGAVEIKQLLHARKCSDRGGSIKLEFVAINPRRFVRSLPFESINRYPSLVCVKFAIAHFLYNFVNPIVAPVSAVFPRAGIAVGKVGVESKPLIDSVAIWHRFPGANAVEVGAGGNGGTNSISKLRGVNAGSSFTRHC